MKRRFFLCLLLCISLFVAGCGNSQHPSSSQAPQRTPSPSPKTELIVAAAASLTDALNELKSSFEQEHADIQLTYTFGSSGKLAQQITQGAPADIFLSASKKDMDNLQKKNLIAADSRTDFAANELVLITRKDSPLSISSFEKLSQASVAHLAIGNPESVPAGRYAKETFETLNMWNALTSKLVLASDVRQVLTYVESGNVDLGVVYTSDALSSDKIKILATAKPEWHNPIVYPGAVISTSKYAAQANVFLDYLTSEKGISILQKHGFYVK